MNTILSDHNCEGHARAIFRMLDVSGYSRLLGIELRLFVDEGLAFSATDEEVWLHCQNREFLLLTGNRRSVEGDLSLEQTIRRLAGPKHLPVITIGNLRRVLNDQAYCQQSSDRLAEILFDLERYRGVSRLYIP